eukprot:823664-Rhodomonas_salina.1
MLRQYRWRSRSVADSAERYAALVLPQPEFPGSSIRCLSTAQHVASASPYAMPVLHIPQPTRRAIRQLTLSPIRYLSTRQRTAYA